MNKEDCDVIFLLSLTALSHRMIERLFSGAVTRYHLIFQTFFCFSPIFERVRVMCRIIIDFMSAVVNCGYSDAQEQKGSQRGQTELR